MKELQPIPYPSPTPEQRAFNLQIVTRMNDVRQLAIERLRRKPPHGKYYQDCIFFARSNYVSRYFEFDNINLETFCRKDNTFYIHGYVYTMDNSFFAATQRPYYMIYRDNRRMDPNIRVTTPYPHPYNTSVGDVVDAKGKWFKFNNIFLFTADGHAVKIEEVDKRSPGLGTEQELVKLGRTMPLELNSSDTRMIPLTGGDFETVEHLISLIKDGTYGPRTYDPDQ